MCITWTSKVLFFPIGDADANNLLAADHQLLMLETRPKGWHEGIIKCWIYHNHYSKKAPDPDGDNTNPKDMEELVKKSSFALCHAPVAVRQLVVALQDYLGKNFWFSGQSKKIKGLQEQLVKCEMATVKTIIFVFIFSSVRLFCLFSLYLTCVIFGSTAWTVALNLKKIV